MYQRIPLGDKYVGYHWVITQLLPSDNLVVKIGLLSLILVVIVIDNQMQIRFPNIFSLQRSRILFCTYKINAMYINHPLGGQWLHVAHLHVHLLVYSFFEMVAYFTSKPLLEPGSYKILAGLFTDRSNGCVDIWNGNWSNYCSYVN